MTGICDSVGTNLNINEPGKALLESQKKKEGKSWLFNALPKPPSMCVVSAVFNTYILLNCCQNVQCKQLLILALWLHIFQEILKSIVERGAQFSEHEFTNLLALAHRSERGAKEDEFSHTLKRLEQILTEHESTAWALQCSDTCLCIAVIGCPAYSATNLVTPC